MGNGKDLLEEYNLSEVRKRMMQLCEYTFNTGLVEDDEDNQQQQPPMQNGGQQMSMNGQQQGGGMPQQDPQMGGQQPMGQDQMGMNQGDMPQGDMGGQIPMDNNQIDAQPADTSEMPPMDMPQGGDEQAPEGDMPEDGMDMGGEDEEVIDVDDLTNSQEATEYKIDGVNDKISELLQVTTKFVDALKDNERQIQDLRKEFELRNPTPEEKMNIIKGYAGGEEPICMIGDGVNDALALTTADAGIAMGGIGSDIAIESADAVLVSDDIKRLPYLFDLMQKVMKKIKVNILASLIINISAVILSAMGVLTPVTGALWHNFGSVFVVVNAALLLRVKDK